MDVSIQLKGEYASQTSPISTSGFAHALWESALLFLLRCFDISFRPIIEITYASLAEVLTCLST